MMKRLPLNLILLLAILVAVNLVSSNSFFRIDLTKNNAYSLSAVSRETLSLLEDPLRVRVFYSADLPAPYNGVRQYLLDLLREFDGAEDGYFSYEIVDMETPEGKAEAQGYGLQQVEIQEIQSDEFQSRAVYMGAAVLYGTVVERVDQIGSTDGLEYRLTTAMNSAVTQVDALSGTSGVTMRVFASPALRELQIQGFAELESEMRDVHNRINRDNFGRIDYEFLEPDSDDAIRSTVEEYGVQPIRWENRTGVRRGVLGIVLSYEDRVERVPLEIFSRLFGGYALDDPANIEESLRQAIRSLVSTTSQVAYAVGTGEMDVNDYQQGAAPFAQLLSERYEIVPVDLTGEDIPAGIDTLIVNGPSGQYSQEALYRIDQFLMGGGSLLAFLDSYRQIVPTQQQMMSGAQPYWEPVTTGLEPLVEHYGINLSETMVLDEESFRTRPGTGGRQSQQIFQAPVLGGQSMNRDNVVTAGLQDLIVLNARELAPSAAGGLPDAGSSAPPPPRYTALLRTSPRSWVVETPEDIGPWTTGVPADAEAGRKDVAALVEGTFTSWFESAVDLGIPAQEMSSPDSADGPDAAVANANAAVIDANDGAGEVPEQGVTDVSALRIDSYRATSIEPGRLLVVGSSAFTTPQLLNPQARTPNGTFLLNAVDYLNGMPGMAELRSKGLGVARIEVVTDASRVTARWGNTIAVPLLVVALGIIVWARRRARARSVRSIFQTGKEG